MIPLPGLEHLHKELTEREERFVVEYCIDNNATQAAIRSGFSPNDAGHKGSELRNKPHIKHAIKVKKQELFDKIEVNRLSLANELKKMAFANIKDVASWGPENNIREDKEGRILVSNGVTLHDSEDLPEYVSAAVQEIGNTKEGVKVKMYDKRAAVMDLAKLGNMIVDRTELTGKEGGPLEIDLTKLSDDELELFATIARRQTAAKESANEDK